MNPTGSRNIHIWDAPESRIQFLETVMQGADWQAEIHAPPMVQDPASYLAATEKTLKEKGYATEWKRNDSGNISLAVRHLGDDVDLLVNLKELGLVAGARRTIENAPVALGHMLNGAWAGIQYATKDSARLLSSIYLIGDIAYTLTGLAEGKKDPAALKKQGNILLRTGQAFAEKLTNFKDASTTLMSLSGIFALAQSLIFLEYARDGSELHLESLRKKMDKSVASDKDPLEALMNDDANNQHSGMLEGIHKLVRAHPIEVGSMSQVLGQVSLFAAAGLNLKRGKVPEGKSLESFRKGEMLNMGRSTASIAGWLALMHSPRDVGEKSPWSDPERIVQEFHSRPEKFASGLNFGASALGLWSSHHRENKFQTMAESTWLLGDVVMAFVNKSHYGHDGQKAEEMAGKAAAEFLLHAPIAYSPAYGEKLYKDVARYISRRTVETNAPEPPAGTDVRLFEKEREAAIDEMAGRLTQSIMTQMAGKQSRYTQIIHQAAVISTFYPEKDRPQVIAALGKAIADAPCIYTSQEDAVEAIASAQTRILRNGGKEAPASAPGMATLAPVVSELVLSLPGLHNANVANAIYDALAPFTRQGPQDELFLNRSLISQAGGTLGLSPQQAQEAMRRQQASTPALS